MPITYSVDPRGFVLASWQGTVTGDDVRAHMRRVADDAAAIALGRSVTDARDAIIAASGSEIAEAFSAALRSQPALAHWRVGIVVARTAQFGSARQFQFLAGELAHAAIFEDLDAAAHWVCAADLR